LEGVIQTDKNPSELDVETFMTSPVKTAETTTPVGEAVEKMQRNDIKHLPVTENGALTGIITTTDILHHSTEFVGELLDLRLKQMDKLQPRWRRTCQTR